MPRPGLAPYDPRWSQRGVDLADTVATALASLLPGDDPGVEHIGSTSVPGLPAKPFIDLQAAVSPLPEDVALVELLSPLGFRREAGARPDSPGVHRDTPRWETTAPAAVWHKSLFTLGDPLLAGAVILHVRRAESPWAVWAVAFRDWLRAHPDERDRYAAVKSRLMAADTESPDFDDYTRAKTAYFDEVEPRVMLWRQSRTPDG